LFETGKFTAEITEGAEENFNPPLVTVFFGHKNVQNAQNATFFAIFCGYQSLYLRTTEITLYRSLLLIDVPDGKQSFIARHRVRANPRKSAANILV